METHAIDYTPPGMEADSRDALLEVEMDDELISIYIDPRTDDVKTIHLTPGQAWAISKDLARAAAVMEEEAAGIK